MEALDSTLYLSNDDLFLFARGEWYRSYEKMGAHPARTEDGTSGFHFAVWAPNVQSVHVIGDFNGWDETATPLEQTETGGVWEGFVPGIENECLYKYLIVTAAGELLFFGLLRLVDVRALFARFTRIFKKKGKKIS